LIAIIEQYNLQRWDVMPIKIIVNGQELKTDVEPVIISDRVMVSVRAIAEALGKTVTWDANTRTVEIK